MKTEKQTRIALIDAALNKAGWNVHDPGQVVQEYDIIVDPDRVTEAVTPYGGHQFSDYVLLGRDRKPLAVVEAKKTSKDAALGREQAKQYCYNICKDKDGELPFCFYTNGLEIYFWDLENYPPRKIVGFPTLDDLERFRYIRKQKKSLTEELINIDIAGRDYQIRAIRAVLEGIERKQRDFLLVMATGTGKTRTAIALVDALMRAAHIERVLFLVDRIALREQGLAAFKEHLPNEPRWPKVGEKLITKDRRIYLATYPTMLKIIRDELSRLSPHFFDLVVIDESHRSIYNTYGEILDYFKAINLGLTATPTDIIDHNTFKLFSCEDGLPTFAYTFEEAVNNSPPYLCSFQVMKIQTRFQMEGISKRTISLEDQKKLILNGEDIEEINFEGSQLEKQVTNKGTNALIVKEFMEECIKDTNGVLPGKTIFFCASKAHARRMEKIFDALYPQFHGELAKVLVSDDPRVYGKGGLLDQFTHKDMPRIAISVAMLDTGIDVHEIVNLVFARPVYSYTKFWQMIGRGTRLLEPAKIKPWCTEKDRFLVLDCWDNFEYFKLQPKGKALKPQIPLPVRLVGIRLDKIEKSLAMEKVDIATKEITKLRGQIKELPLSINIVAREKALIQSAQLSHYWATANDATLDELAEKLSPLMIFRNCQNPDQGPVKLDLTGVLYNKEMVEFGPQNEAVSVFKYREMVETLVLTLTHSNPILQKIKNGADISATEVEKLAGLLSKAHPHITENLLRIVYQNRKARFIQFMRHILGIEIIVSFPDTVAEAFDQFIADHTNLNSRQLEFLRLLKDFILEREKVEKRNLIESPFTIIHPQGIRGVFRPTEIDEILELTEKLAA